MARECAPGATADREKSRFGITIVREETIPLMVRGACREFLIGVVGDNFQFNSIGQEESRKRRGVAAMIGTGEIFVPFNEMVLLCGGNMPQIGLRSYIECPRSVGTEVGDGDGCQYPYDDGREQ